MPTTVTIVGNLVKDPEEKDFGSNKNVTRFRVASSDRVPDGNGGWKDGETAYYSVSAWRNLGKHTASTLKKGDKVIVQGRIKYSEFKRQDGSNGHSYEIEATDVGVALTAKTSKAGDTSNSGTENPWGSSKITVSSEETDAWS
jgi:single-strand DNA-binding protein